MTPKELENEILPLLVAAFPKAFASRGLPCQPLKIGVHADILAVLPGVIDPKKLRTYMSVYVGASRYLKALTPGATRIGLDGEAAGSVTAEEAKFAAVKWQAKHGPKSEASNALELQSEPARESQKAGSSAPLANAAIGPVNSALVAAGEPTQAIPATASQKQATGFAALRVAAEARKARKREMAEAMAAADAGKTARHRDQQGLDSAAQLRQG